MRGGDIHHSYLPSAREDAARAKAAKPTPQTQASSYSLAFTDSDFLLREELRPVRLQLELLKPELILQEHGIEATIVVFGSARNEEPEAAAAQLQAAEEAHAVKASSETQKALQQAKRVVRHAGYYEQARRFAEIVTTAGRDDPSRKAVIVTGGGPGIMEAANRGALEIGGETIGHNITLPHEQAPNSYITPELCFQFHYFAIRKMHLLMRARALVVFPGGYGTLDELFECLCLMQTGKARQMPVLLFDEAYWRRIVNFEALVEEGVIGAGDLDLFTYVSSAEEAWAHIQTHAEMGPRRARNGTTPPSDGE